MFAEKQSDQAIWNFSKLQGGFRLEATIGDDFTCNKSRIPPLLKRQAWREASSHASDMLVYLAVRKFYHGPSWTALHGCILVEFYPASSVILNCFGYFDGCFCFHFSVEFLLFPFPSAFYQSKDGEKCHFPCLSRRSHVLSRHPKRFLMLPSSFSDSSAGHLALSFQCSKCRGRNGGKFTQKASQFSPSMVKSLLIKSIQKFQFVRRNDRSKRNTYHQFECRERSSFHFHTSQTWVL